MFKVLDIAFKTLNVVWTKILEGLSVLIPACSSRTSNEGLLRLSSHVETRRVGISDRVFLLVALGLWNSLLFRIRQPISDLYYCLKCLFDVAIMNVYMAN